VKILSGFKWLRIKSNGGFSKHGNEPSGSMKCGVFHGHLSDSELQMYTMVLHS
jgi:hypothetical protein